MLGLIILLGLFAGLRFECDNDYLEYVRIYNQAPTLWEFFAGGYNLSDVYGEPFFVVTNVVFKSIKAPEYIYFTFVAFLNLFFLYKVIVGFSKYWFLSLFLYVSLMYLGGGFTQIRFGVATTLAWYGLLEYYRGKSWQSVLIIICATMFHISAIAIFIIYITNRILKLNTMGVLVVSGLAIMVTFFSLSDLFGRLLGVLLGDSRYISYLTGDDYTEKANSFSIYFYCFNILIYWFFREQIIKDTGENRFVFFLKVGLAAVFFGAVFNQMAILSRFGLIMQFVYIFIIPHTIGLRPVRLSMLIFLFAYGVLRYNQFLSENSFIQKYQNVITK